MKKIDLKLYLIFNYSLAALLLLGLNLTSLAQKFPTGFKSEQIVSLDNPTAYTFAPDGRIFACEEEGNVRIIKDGNLLPDPFITLSDVYSSVEKGLIGIILHPNFNENGYVYLYYTKSLTSTSIRNEIMRVTADGDQALVGNDTTILTLDIISNPNINYNHDGGAMKFGPDGKLYICVGNNYMKAARGKPPVEQDLDLYHGKILRVNDDGSIPDGNPFTSGTNTKKRIWAFGLRNPFTMHFKPATNHVVFTEVGSEYPYGHEEINEISQGGQNFGFPYVEGYSTNPAYTSPLYSYITLGQDNTSPSNTDGCAITGGVFFSPSVTNYPDKYKGKYFFNDFCKGWLDMLDFSNDTVVRSSFAREMAGGGHTNGTLSLEVGNDGNIYYMVRSGVANASGIYKITYTNPLAVKDILTKESILISPNPASGNVGINFTAESSEEINISIQDILGDERLNFASNTVIGFNHLNLDIQKLEKGIYFLNIKSGRQNVVKKFLVD